MPNNTRFENFYTGVETQFTNHLSNEPDLGRSENAGKYRSKRNIIRGFVSYCFLMKKWDKNLEEKVMIMSRIYDRTIQSYMEGLQKSNPFLCEKQQENYNGFFSLLFKKKLAVNIDIKNIGAKEKKSWH